MQQFAFVGRNRSVAGALAWLATRAGAAIVYCDGQRPLCCCPASFNSTPICSHFKARFREHSCNCIASAQPCGRTLTGQLLLASTSLHHFCRRQSMPLLSVLTLETRTLAKHNRKKGTPQSQTQSTGRPVASGKRHESERKSLNGNHFDADEERLRREQKRRARGFKQVRGLRRKLAGASLRAKRLNCGAQIE